MKRSRFTTEQIIAILQEHRAGAEAGEQGPVDGPPPVAEMRAFRAGHHGLLGPSFTSRDHRTEW